MFRVRHASALLVLPLGVALAACGGDDVTPAPAASTVADEMSDEMTGESMSDDQMSGEAMAERPIYQTLSISDVDGVAFTLYDLAGTPVLVEPFATWCPSCRGQLGATNEAADTLGDGAVVLALSVETDLPAADVAAYAEESGFDHSRFAVMSPEMLAALVDEFGNSIANPPSTPRFVLDAMGHAGELTTGRESAADIVAAVTALQA